MDRYKEAVFGWVDRRMGDLSEWNQTIWHYGETALREYKSAAWYVARLKRRGVRGRSRHRRHADRVPRHLVQRTTARASRAYAEYDAVPGNCQAAATRKMPRAGLSPHAGGHTDPHSALGISALGGALAAKAAMTRAGAQGHHRVLRRAGGEVAPVQAGACGQGLLRQAGRRDQLPPDAICCRWSTRRAGIPIAARAMPASTPSNAPSRKAG